MRKLLLVVFCLVFAACQNSGEFSEDEIAPLALVTQKERPFSSKGAIFDLVYCRELNLVVGGTDTGIQLWNPAGESIAIIGSQTYVPKIALSGTTLYSVRSWPPTVEAWDLSTKKGLARFPLKVQSKCTGYSSHGPPPPKLCLALAPKSGKLAAAYEGTVYILNPKLKVIQELKRPRFLATPTLSMISDGKDVTDQFYRLQSVFWSQDERSVMAFVGQRMGAFGWSWNLDESKPRPIDIPSGPGHPPGENSRVLMKTGDVRGHPQWLEKAWLDQREGDVELRIIDCKESSWARELSRRSADGRVLWRQVFRFPANAHSCFAIVGDQVVLGGGQGIYPKGRLTTRRFDLKTGQERP